MIAMTLLVRDEIDIIPQWYQHHKDKADLFVITDNGSLDGTREFLAAIAADDKRVIIIDEPGRDYMQHIWVDRMIKQAIEKGAEWIINSDADEFWDANFRELISRYGDKANVFRITSQLFVNSIFDDKAEVDCTKRMRYRLIKPRNKDEAYCFGAWNKMVHNAKDYQMNILGNHDVKMNNKNVIDIAINEARIRHYPERSFDHYRRKYIQGGEAYANNTVLTKDYGFHWRNKYAIYANGSIIALELEYAKSIMDEKGLKEFCIKE